MNKAIFLSSLIFLFLSCQKAPRSLECDKLKSSNEAFDLMESLFDNKMDNISEIKKNLIGEWGLIGVTVGFRQSLEPGLFCYSLNITEDNIELINHESGEVTNTPWQLKIHTVRTSSLIYLSTNEDSYNNRIGMTTFTKDHMFGEGLCEDCSIYIYEKLN